MILASARAGLRAGIIALVLQVLLSPGRSGAQEILPDTLVVDSTRLRVMGLLERLSRPPVPDSLVLVTDSIQLFLSDSARAAERAGETSRTAGADSVFEMLLALPGYETTRFEGEKAEYAARDRRLTLVAAEGAPARVQREGVELAADSAIIYDEQRGRVRSAGRSTFRPEQGDEVNSATMVYDLEEGRGSALGAETKYTEGANWIVRGDMPYVDGRVFYGNHIRFTSCDEEQPHYHFESDEIKIVNESVLVARPVRLYFADVPVAWLPFIAQGLGSGRSSGILTPRFSVNDIVSTSSGYKRRISNVGFYWAASDYADAAVAMDWFSEEFFAMTGAGRYRWASQFLEGDLAYKKYWREDGSQELGFDTRHSWEMNERTSVRVSARYASSTDFVRRNSFDPREVTQSIDSDGGLNRRFDWGNLSLSANRRQYLSDDRVEMTLPTANLSLSTITLFRAPPARGRFYNNLTWSGGANFSRRTSSPGQADSVFTFSGADKANSQASVRSTLNLGSLSVSQNLSVSENVLRGVPDTVFAQPEPLAESQSFFQSFAEPGNMGSRDLAQADLNWSTSINYQQRLIGATTLTPSFSISGRALRSDTIPEASSFFSAPSRISFGAQLNTDIYGFFGGFGPYDLIRHKISPSFSYSYSPESTPTELQQRIFGSREIQPRNVLSMGLNQTIEARVRVEEEEREEGEAADSTSRGATQTAKKVKLLGIQTSVLEYDFVEADSAGNWTAGFTTTRLRNTISSDFLRGLNVAVEHDLFDTGEAGSTGDRRLAPHLSQMNLSFSLSSQSRIFRLFGLLGGDGAEGVPEEEIEEEEEAFDVSGIQEAEIVPGLGRSRNRDAGIDRGTRSRGGGGWNANISYSLNRPREGTGETTQMAQGTLSFDPTPGWSVNWRTSYDIEAGHFNDHMIRLTRTMHRWEASFDFRQTATGNWTLLFEVSLLDNRDLKFDYSQRNLEEQSGFRR